MGTLAHRIAAGAHRAQPLARPQPLTVRGQLLIQMRVVVHPPLRAEHEHDLAALGQGPRIDHQPGGR